MKPRALLGVLLAVATGAALGGCDDTKKVLGLEKRAPDEFAVYSRAPLSLPPNYALRPPAPGENRPQETNATMEAERALRGKQTVQLPANASPGTTSLLQRTGSLNALPNIRATVNLESTSLADEDKRVSDKILFWKKPDAPGVVVDAEKEAQRIRENQAMGKPITEGETPSIQKRKRGLF